VTLVTHLCCDLNTAGLLPVLPDTYDKRQAVLLHRLVALQTFAAILYQSSDKSMAERQALVLKYGAVAKACEGALHAYAANTFGADFEAKLRSRLMAATERFSFRQA
jgi:hypothetical protein